MTKKIFLPLVSFLLTFAVMPLLAQTRTEADAQAIAESFFPKSRGGEDVSQTLAYTERDSATSHPYYYVFNRGNEQGWIIICADGRTKSILGYGDTGHFDMATAPPEMKSWLKDYSEQLRDLSVTPDEVLKNLDQYVLNKARSKGSQSFANAVKPLLGRIEYGQDYPYNIMTPVYYGENSVTGCVATGIVQIMRYWQYPKTPTGKSHTYTLYGEQLGTYFNTAYDWRNMLPTYSNVQSTQRQNNAIAKLMSDVGISSDMEYSPDQSGAYTAQATGRLADYFDYDRNMIIYKRRDFSDANFVYFLKRELNAGRPVVFAGWGGGSGHCFVCDGYDTNGLFHFNWGWDGMCNGYYSINNLVPAQTGTGGGYGHYNDDVLFIGGIRPNTGKGRRTWLMRADDLYYPNKGTLGQRSTFSLTKLENETPDDVKGSAGIALYKDGKMVQIIGQQSFGNLEIEHWWDKVTINVTWPSSMVSGGDYQAVAVFKAAGDDRWRAVAHRTCNSFDVSVSGRSVSIKPNTRYQYVDLDDNAFDITPDGYEQGVREYDPNENTTNPVMAAQLSFQAPVRSGNVTAKAVLTSSGSYQGKVGVFLYDSQFDNCVATLQAKTVSVRDGNTNVSFNGVVNLSPGTYGAAIFYTDRQGKWLLVPDEEYSCVTFNIALPGGINPPSPSDNIIPGGDDDDDWNENYNENDNDLKYYNEDDDDYGDYYCDEETDDNGDYDFFDFLGDIADLAHDIHGIFSKGGNTSEPFKCESLQFAKAQPTERNGKSIYSFRLGQEEELSVKVTNSKDSEYRRILTASLYDSDDNWVADMSEIFVIVPANGSKTVHMPLQFTDIPPGPYRLCITETASENDESRQMQPQASSQMYIQIKR